MRDPTGQFNTNIIKEVIKDFSEIPASLETLIDLGTIYTYTHLMFLTSLDEDVTIKLGDNEFTVLENKNIWFDGLKFNGIIQFKKKDGAPTEGNLQVLCY